MFAHAWDSIDAYAFAVAGFALVILVVWALLTTVGSLLILAAYWFIPAPVLLTMNAKMGVAALVLTPPVLFAIRRRL